MNIMEKHAFVLFLHIKGKYNQEKKVVKIVDVMVALKRISRSDKEVLFKNIQIDKENNKENNKKK